jgi:hypothetical protein
LIQRSLFSWLAPGNLAKAMAGPGPDADQIETILQIGTRTDHRKLAPWTLTLFKAGPRPLPV